MTPELMPAMKPKAEVMLAMSAGPKKDKTDGMPKFKAPEGFAAPEDVKPGDSFNFVGEGYMDKDGQICMTSVDGAKFQSGQPEDEDADNEMPPDNDADDAGDTGSDSGKDETVTQDEGNANGEGAPEASMDDEIAAYQKKMKGR